ncbi:hypothetical protein CK556_01630 [Mesoplasma chauliocola]|uniref:J domain-containing protein n=1 Tax=Mesoplasma chauliocola TaxID=216427 RepID=A0A249SN23_9MOLU|nr:DnaJ domain-containing protein [Mesoplasma chauliocola]ASZ09056.1 hypothetical protein CK556_01630 [Mesoplasma chauliocola]
MLKNTDFINNLKIQEQPKEELLFLYEHLSTKSINLMNKFSFELDNMKNVANIQEEPFFNTIESELKLKVFMKQNIIENRIQNIDENFNEIDLKKLEQLINEIIYKLNENYVYSLKKVKEYVLTNYEINFADIEIETKTNKKKFEDFSHNNILKANSTNNFWSYEILGINLNATDAQIKQAYKALAKKYHPDNNKDPEAEEIMKLINKAYNILKGKE